MNEVNQSTWINLKNVIVFLLGVGLTYLVVTNILETRVSDLESQTKKLIEDQRSVIVTIAETTARNGADSVTESIVKDCVTNERSKFDELLGRLNDNLNQTELTELDRLFGRCGSFYSERKSVMVSKLAREIEVYETYVSQLSVLLDNDFSSDYKVQEWQQLASLEQKHGELFTELVALQDQIISNLLNGGTAGSDEIIAILQAVGEVQGSLTVTLKQAEAIRSSLVSS